MQLRCNIQLGDDARKLVLVTQENETPEHLALKLAAFVLFFGWNPQAEISAKHPAVSGQEFRPDLIALDQGGDIRLWVECGNVATNKVEKLARRYRSARLVVLKETRREALNLRRILEKNESVNRDHVEIWAFPDGEFAQWLGALEESVDIVGEPLEKGFNLVLNATPLSFDLASA